MTMASSIPPITEYVPVTRSDAAIFAAFLSVWTSVYYRTVLSPATGRPEGFSQSAFVSNLNACPLCVLGLLSLWRVIPETVPLSWSMSFFFVDLVDTIVRRDAMWFVHAVISQALNVCFGFSARHRELRTVSKGFLTEASSPFLNYWKKSKSYASFLTFFLVYTSCRVIWVPYFLHRMYYVTLGGEVDYVIWPSILFYILQLVWYAKMCSVVLNYRPPKKEELRLDSDGIILKIPKEAKERRKVE